MPIQNSGSYRVASDYNNRGNAVNIVGSPLYQAAQAEANRKKTQLATQEAQDRINAEEKRQMDMRAQQLALQQAEMLAQTQTNPRTTTGTQMEISNAGTSGDGGGYGSGSGGGSSGGGGGYAAAAKSPQQQAYEMSQAMQQLYSSMPQPQMPTLQRTPAPAVPELTGPSAAFSRAKDASGRTGAAATRALKDLMTRRGMSDSNMEAAGEAQILSGVQQQQAGAEYDAADQDAARRWESAKLGYGGDTDYNNLMYQSQVANQQRQQDMIMQLLSQIRY